MDKEKPPLGLMPSAMWIQHRIQDLSAAIKRYADACVSIPEEWVVELFYLVEQQKEN